MAAATQRRFFTNSVITNQGHPADHLFLLTKGLLRYFLRKIGNRLEYRRASLVLQRTTAPFDGRARGMIASALGSGN